MASDRTRRILEAVKNIHYSDKTTLIQLRGQCIQKPIAILDYNAGKSSIDLSDQMSSYLQLVLLEKP